MSQAYIEIDFGLDLGNMSETEYSNPISNWVVVSFSAGSSWKFASKRLQRQIFRYSIFSNFLLLDESWLKSMKRALVNGKNIEDMYPKGYGLWHWKPLAIEEALRQYPECEGVVYLDVGCEINYNKKSIEKLISYQQIAIDRGGLAFELEVAEIQYSSEIVWKSISGKHPGENRQVSATVIFLPNTENSIQFLKEWSFWCSTQNYALLRGSNHGNSPENPLHRHDQAILSQIWRMHRKGLVDDETFWPNKWIKEGLNFPIWATRNKSIVSVNKPKMLRKFIRVIEKVLTI